MKLCVFSDIHSNVQALQRCLDLEADIWIAAGDMVNWERRLDAIGKILHRRAPNLWLLPGNHESHASTSRLCQEYGLQDFHGRSFECGGFHVAGLGYSTPTPFDTPGEYSEEEMARRLAPFAGLNPLVLVCHCPPKNTPLDEAGPGAHFGSKSVAEFVAANKPRYLLCGHIHEAAGRSVPLNDVTIGRSVGPAGFVLDLSSL